MAILLVDSYSLLFRAHYALPPMSTSEGEPTGALYGVSLLLLKLLREERPEGVAFALDAPGGTFRHDVAPSYKAGRARVDEALLQQLGRFDELVAALGVPAHRVPGFEADDLLASLASRLEAPAVIVSGDRDLFQCVGPRVEVLFTGRRGGPQERYDLAAIDARYGVAPRQLPSVTALVGDPADNLPKVEGVGIKTACRWVREHGDVAGVLSAAASLKPAGAAAALVAVADLVRQSEVLGTRRCDVPLGEPLHGPITDAGLDALAALFAALEFGSLLPRLDKLRADQR